MARRQRSLNNIFMVVEQLIASQLFVTNSVASPRYSYINKMKDFFIFSSLMNIFRGSPTLNSQKKNQLTRQWRWKALCLGVDR